MSFNTSTKAPKINRLSPKAVATLAFMMVLSSPFALRAQDGQQKIANLGQCRLESGKVIEDCRVGYRTYGHLNATGDNAVLVPTWLYGESSDLASLFGDGSSPQQLIDTGKFYGIAIDAFANGVSSSPSNSPKQHGTDFPAITLRDSVNAQYRVLTEVLHLKHLRAVVGLSMGGEQAFDWSAMYPKFFDLAVPVLGTPRPTSYDLHVKTIQVESIESDPGYAHGHYTAEPALKLANLIGTLVVTTPEFRNRETPRDKLQVFIAHAEGPVSLDANDRVWQLKAIMQQDVIGQRTPEDAARSTPVHFLIIVSAQDHLVNPQPALDWASAIGAPTYIATGDCAHLIMSCDAEGVSTRVKAFLLTGKMP
jgi:homoserine O-acetyltransferase/O-succinyltransferase